MKDDIDEMRRLIEEGPTPKTDAVQFSAPLNRSLTETWVKADFARTLERQLNAALAFADVLKERVTSLESALEHAKGVCANVDAIYGTKSVEKLNALSAANPE